MIKTAKVREKAVIEHINGTAVREQVAAVDSIAGAYQLAMFD